VTSPSERSAIAVDGDDAEAFVMREGMRESNTAWQDSET
jgi:hypothetical protein